jgi:hypothetical protein
MPILLLLTVAFAAFFYRVADYERLSPFVWGLASVAVTGIVVMIGFGAASLIVAQIGLFAVFWRYNVRHKQEQMREP